VKRRSFIHAAWWYGGGVAGGGAGAASREAATIGLLCRHAFVPRPLVAAFVSRLRDLGWIEGRTVLIEYRWAEGRSERFAEIAAEFVKLKLDIIVTGGTVNTLAGKAGDFGHSYCIRGRIRIQSTRAWSRNLARPGGNVTGLSVQQSDLVGKRLELLREVVPALRRLAIMANGGESCQLGGGTRTSHHRGSQACLAAETLEIRKP